MIYCDTLSTFWRKTFLSLFLVSIFQQAFDAEGCPELGPNSNYSELNTILKCLGDKIDKGSSTKGTASQSNPTEAKKPAAKTSIEKLPVFRAIGSSESSSNYEAQHVLDGKIGLAWGAVWQTKDGQTKGEWVELQLNQPCVIEKLVYYLVLGGGAQIRQATVKFDNGSPLQLKFDYATGMQERFFTPQKAEKVRIIVDDIFPENRGYRLEIAEIELHGSQCEK